MNAIVNRPFNKPTAVFLGLYSLLDLCGLLKDGEMFKTQVSDGTTSCKQVVSLYIMF